MLSAMRAWYARNCAAVHVASLALLAGENGSCNREYSRFKDDPPNSMHIGTLASADGASFFFYLDRLTTR
jgi:hypothetical protein